MSEDDRIWCAPYEVSMSARSCAMQRSRSVQMAPHSIEGQRLSRCRDCRAGERRLVVLGVKSKGGDGRVRQWR